MSYMRSIYRFELSYSDVGECISKEEENKFNSLVQNIIEFNCINMGVGYEKYVGKTSDGSFMIQENTEKNENSSVITVQFFSDEDEFINSVKEIAPFNSTKEFFKEKLLNIVSIEKI